jgi:8-oxo-dGTP diphosphatase
MVNKMKKSFDLRKGVDFIGVTCVFFCHDGKGNLLMHKRSQKCRDEQGKWDTGCGSMEFGETFEQTVKREIKEEYCVTPKNLRQVGVFNVLRKNDKTQTHWIKVLFVAQVDPKKVKIGEPDKMENLQWFKSNRLPKPLHSQLKKDLERLKKIGVNI